MPSKARLKFLKKMIILGPKTTILEPQFCRILVLGPHFWWSGGGWAPGAPPPGSAPDGITQYNCQYYYCHIIASTYKQASHKNSHSELDSLP